jgi:3-oxoacyl-[acyl-carrier protein] reductase
MGLRDRPPKVAVVLAGTRGIGRACAERLAADGHAVVTCGRQQETLDQVLADLRSAGARAEGLVADVSDEAAAAGVVDHALDAFGRVDVLVANCGGPRPGTFEELSTEDWYDAFRLTFLSVVASVRRALPPRKEQGRGRIVVIGSSSTRAPLKGLTTSNALRPALDGLVKSLAVELAPCGITVNMACPGKVDTDRVRELDERRASQSQRGYLEQREATERAIPAGRYGRPEEVAALVGFMASDAAAYLTGQSVLVDGAHVPTLP